MNIIDICAIAILALFALSGLYRGFLTTLINIGAYIVSVLLGFLFMPLGASAIKGSESLYNMMLYYTEGSEYITNAEYVRLNIASPSAQELADVVSTANLPYPMNREISANIAKEVFADQGITTLGDYFNQTIVCVFINILVFLLVFAVVRLVLAFIINGVDYAWTFPILRRGDAALGMCMGLIDGMFGLFLIFMLLPIGLTVLGQFQQIQTLVDESAFATVFYRSNFLLALMPGA